MKILIIAFHGLNNGAGTERVCSMLANGLFESNYEVVLASIGPCDKPFFPINKGIKIIPLVNYSRSNLGRLPVSAYNIKNIHNTMFRIKNSIFDPADLVYKIRKLLKKECIDTVIAMGTNCIHFTLPATLGLSVNHIVWEAFGFNSNQNKKGAKVNRLVGRHCDSVVTQTKKDSKFWLEDTSYKSQVTAIANPCPFPTQDYIQEKSTKIVLAVGRLSHRKGFDLLLEAWIQVAKIMPDWKLKIVGEGEKRAKLTEFIEENKLTDSVKLVGNTNDVSKYYKEAEIFCLSSRFEGFGVVLIEALTFGLPIISFDCEVGPAEVLEGTGSVLVPRNNVEKLALSLIELMKDDEKRKTISLKGKEKAKIYQPEEIIPQWTDLLESFG